jgi:hypothetical protein
VIRYVEIPGQPCKDQVNQGAILRANRSRDFFLAEIRIRPGTVFLLIVTINPLTARETPRSRALLPPTRCLMKKGMILYVTQEQNEVPPHGLQDLIETSRSLGVSAVSVALSQEDVVSGWVHLVAGGVGEVLFMTVAYDASRGSFESRGAPLRLCG